MLLCEQGIFGMIWFPLTVDQSEILDGRYYNEYDTWHKNDVTISLIKIGEREKNTKDKVGVELVK